MATDKQIDYALSLLRQAGYSDGWMNAQFKELGASMRERKGKVRDWLAAMTKGAISELIARLKDKTDES